MLDVGKFVRFLHPDFRINLYGKLISTDSRRFTVEYLMDPETGVFDVYDTIVDEGYLEPFIPKEKDIVYYQAENGFWDYGILDRHVRTGELFSRINGKVIKLEALQLLSKTPKDKANRYLQNLVLSPRDSVIARSNFFKSYIKQRALCFGVESCTSSLLNLEDYQLNVAKRVLEDPLSRYVLADEVGLGKTIEAGFVIRQTMIDLKFEARICVVCPKTLITQWSEELSEKFQLNLFLSFPEQLGSISRQSQIEIVSHEVLKRSPLYSNYDLVIIDEAHKVMPRNPSAISGILFRTTQELTRNAKSVLMLSATPALHNELGFLSMLSIIDPISYKVNQLSNFKDKINKRVEVAELIAGLFPENLFAIDTVIFRIRELFGQNEALIKLLDDFEDYVIDVLDEKDPIFESKLSNLRSYLSEAYKLNHRVIKNRRENLKYVTINRAGVTPAKTKDPVGNFAEFNNILENWSIQRSIETDEIKLKNFADMHFQLRERLYNYYSGNFGKFGYFATNPNYVGDVVQFTTLLSFLRKNSFFFMRLKGLQHILDKEFHERAKFVVFTSCSKTADYIYNSLRADYPESCFRHSIENDNWKEFNDKIFRAILVCDESAEEGLNIQGDNRHIVHFDLPLNVNRIEQRMGRIDRYGGNEALKSFIILNSEDQFEIEWAKLLNSAVKIFDQSVASLQYLIEDHLTGENFNLQILGRRSEFISAKSKELRDTRGQTGIISHALKQLKQEDRLEEIADPPEDLFYDLKSYDASAENIENSCRPWIENYLSFSLSDRQKSIFEYGYVSSSTKNTILNREWLAEVKKFEARATGVRTPLFTYNREAGNNTAGQKPSLLRFGNTFLDSIFSTTRMLPHGKSSLTWIYDPVIKRILLEPILVLKSHVIVEANATLVKQKTKNWEDPRFKMTDGIIQRRCDALYPPTYDMIVTTSIEGIRQDQTINTIINSIDELDESNIFVEDGFKFDLSNKSLDNFYNNFPGAQNWDEVMLNLTKISHSELNENYLQKTAKVLNSYQQKLNKRLNRYKAILDPVALELEENLNQLLIDAVKTPKISFIASEAIILSGDKVLTRKMIS